MTTLEIKLEDRLRQMTGHTFLYKAKPVKVLSHQFDGENCTVVTSGPWVTEPQATMLKTLDDFLEMDEDEPETAVARVVPKIEALGSFRDLKDIMMNNIRRLEQDKDFIPQAQQISNSVKQIIDLARVEIDAVKAIHEITRKS